MQSDFAQKLLEWDSSVNRREMPWKGEKDPYRVWLSEIMLQQTRVEQGRAYYERFVTAFPTIHDLAAADDGTVFKLWEGLGYYSRCKNLLATARYISDDLGGAFPDSYDKIIRLKGIGPYTAAAIASFVFDEKRAVVDGNVQRVIARYFGLSTPIDSTEGKKLFSELAKSLLDDNPPAKYNQAIMDFGATVCRPKNPLCQLCPEAKECEAFRHGFADRLPVKEKSLSKKNRWLYYFIVEVGDSVYLRKRESRDIWQNLYEFVLVEKDEPDEENGIGILGDLLQHPFSVHRVSREYSQHLTHQRIRGRFTVIRMGSAKKMNGGYHLVPRSALAGYAFPKFINSYLLDESETL